MQMIQRTYYAAELHEIVRIEVGASTFFLVFFSTFLTQFFSVFSSSHSSPSLTYFSFIAFQSLFFFVLPPMVCASFFTNHPLFSYVIEELYKNCATQQLKTNV